MGHARVKKRPKPEGLVLLSQTLNHGRQGLGAVEVGGDDLLGGNLHVKLVVDGGHHGQDIKGIQVAVINQGGHILVIDALAYTLKHLDHVVKSNIIHGLLLSFQRPRPAYALYPTRAVRRIHMAFGFGLIHYGPPCPTGNQNAR